MTRKVPAPDLVPPMADLNSAHKPKIVVFDEHLVLPSTWKEGIPQIDVQHLFG